MRCAFPQIRSGRQLFFYKRAQIFVGDVWGAFHGTGLGCFPDIGQLTMFAGGWVGEGGRGCECRHALHGA